MELKIVVPAILMSSAFLLYLFVGYKFIRKHKRGKDATDKTL